VNDERILGEPRGELVEREASCQNDSATSLPNTARQEEHSIVESLSQPLPVAAQLLGDFGAIGKSKQYNVHGELSLLTLFMMDAYYKSAY